MYKIILHFNGSGETMAAKTLRGKVSGNEPTCAVEGCRNHPDGVYRSYCRLHGPILTSQRKEKSETSICSYKYCACQQPKAADRRKCGNLCRYCSGRKCGRPLQLKSKK